MGLILCATRGGEASFRTQEAAIDLARKQGDDIVFIYVVDLGFLDRTAAPIVVDVENELDQMGTFFLIMAEEKAKEKGVQARTITRHGTVQEEIIEAVRDENATTVVLGRPAGSAGSESAFQAASLEAFAKKIVAETKAEAIIV
ncbi:MAG: universal stress protein [Chloroflexi bacterium]|nr:universal stress protein [Chloroflexota bacterium]